MCVIVPIKGGFEIKNIATTVMMRRHGMASALIHHVVELARERGADWVEIGTSTTSHDQIRLYEKLGFKQDGILRDYFLNYPEPIIENGFLARDMVMLRLNLKLPFNLLKLDFFLRVLRGVARKRGRRGQE